MLIYYLDDHMDDERQHRYGISMYTTCEQKCNNFHHSTVIITLILHQIVTLETITSAWSVCQLKNIVSLLTNICTSYFSQHTYLSANYTPFSFLNTVYTKIICL